MSSSPVKTNLDRFAFGRPIVPSLILLRAAPRPATALAGRVLIAAIFVVSGLAKLLDREGSMGYMAQQGIPWVAGLVIIAGVAEVAGGLSLISGFLTRVGALGLLVFMVITTLVFHDFWNLSGAAAKTEMVNFFKNLGIMGGLMLLIADGPGRYSLDARMRHREP
jgi:putative oxidoreductase